ncbi:AntA domain-containing phage antirepressor (plasmid) [Candidatus Megaera polyxenophila]|nr:AntA domain-containing phage antirepressor [Candidatus Megaera polyxenophila]
MNITIIEHKDLVRVISARELHEFLGVKTDFTNWCKRNNEYLDFKEDIDYIIYAKNGEKSENGRGRPSVDYFYSIDAAKEISMGQGTEKGKKARRYFIECERKLKDKTAISLPNFSSPYEAALAWAEAYKQKEIAQIERDEAIKTKAWIGNKREATAMATAANLSKKINKLEDELGKGKNFKEVKAIPWLSEYFYLEKPGSYSQIGKILKAPTI